MLINKKVIIGTAFAAMMLSACGANNNNLNDTAFDDRNLNEPLRVNYENNDRNNRPNEDNDNTRSYNVNDNGNPGLEDYRLYGGNRVNNAEDEINHSMEVADRVADKITDMQEVDTANVIVTDNNAYVAASLENVRNLETRETLENKISDQVKSVDQDIDQVYVSFDPDFNNRMTNYADNIRNGEPVEGFFDEFNEMVRRIFPTRND
ncbi:YhcN/YlaJ family sporulation lipoprotein [Cytobacillus gottheilii]|uniref:YhcN/YlaJ family sporulation lipoprotein n=1 Tax=Cytobacillus gottheilii TaxID=859144 RepID=UPI0009BC7061|nr:YhcN/YlaJ family sporulation lipoprotein [Cytobacillus gottheilii]